MEGGSVCKPYLTAIWSGTRFKKEIMALRAVHVETMLPYLNENTDEEWFNEMVCICYEQNGRFLRNRITVTRQAIDDILREKRAEKYTLYSSRNISFNQCIGNSKVPVSEWLDVTKQDCIDRE